ncbi:BMA-PIFK-1, isoform a [Dirofilaria immitis]|nr:BMA-PIFK-1, isoform a [Dirofilaria immitis]
MSVRKLSDCDHSKTGICARCVLQKTFNLSNNENICMTQPQRLSCNSLYSLCANDTARSPLAAKCNTASFSIDDETLSVFKKGVSLESLNLGPRTAGDGADDEESLTSIITSGDCIWQENYEDNEHTSRLTVSDKYVLEKQENLIEAHAEPEKNMKL